MSHLEKYRTPIPNVPEEIWQKPLYFIAFGFGSGALPVAPGTFGTLLAIPFYYLLPTSFIAYFLFVLAFIVFSSWVCEKVSREIHIHDHQGMNLDEFAGFFVTMLFAPQGWIWLGLGFILFRLFDIWKPWPINWIDKKVGGGFGMVLDDVVAGIFALFCLQIFSIFV